MVSQIGSYLGAATALLLALVASAGEISSVVSFGGPTAPLPPTDQVGRVVRAVLPHNGVGPAPVVTLRHSTTRVELVLLAQGAVGATTLYVWNAPNDLASLGVDRGVAATRVGGEIVVLVCAPGRVVVSGSSAQTVGALDVLRFDANTHVLRSARAITGNQVGSGYCADVAIVGDVDGDGQFDAAVSAPRFTATASQEGRVWILSAVELDTLATIANAPRSLWSGAAGARFGSQVAAIGDTNGDGFADIGVMSFLTTSNAPAISVYLGAPGELSPTPAWTLTYGASLAGGDFNGDGLADIAVGIPLAGADQQGRVRVFYGHSTGPSLAADWIGTPPGDSAARQFFGNSLAFTPSLNGRPFADLVVGAPQFVIAPATTKDGAVYVYTGGIAPSTVARARILGPDRDAQWGASLAPARAGLPIGAGLVVAGAPTSVDGTGYLAALADPDGDRLFDDGFAP